MYIFCIKFSFFFYIFLFHSFSISWYRDFIIVLWLHSKIEEVLLYIFRNNERENQKMIALAGGRRGKGKMGGSKEGGGGVDKDEKKKKEDIK